MPQRARYENLWFISTKESLTTIVLNPTLNALSRRAGVEPALMVCAVSEPPRYSPRSHNRMRFRRAENLYDKNQTALLNEGSLIGLLPNRLPIPLHQVMPYHKCTALRFTGRVLSERAPGGPSVARAVAHPGDLSFRKPA